ncbi:MAG: hypothetical protein AAFR71_13815 [Pseudomonadota bacterium]
MTIATRTEMSDSAYDMTNVIIFPGLRAQPVRLRRPLFAAFPERVCNVRHTSHILRASAPLRPPLARGSVSPLF